MKIKHIAAGLALLAMPFTAQAEVREAGLVDGFGMSLIYPAVHTKNIAAENAINKDITGYVRRMKELYESGEKQEVYMPIRQSMKMKIWCLSFWKHRL